MNRLLLILFLLVPGIGLAQTQNPSLWDSTDPRMQQKLEQLLNQQQLSSAASKGQLSLALVDISEPAKPRVASVNGDKMVYAASMPKIAILLGAFVLIESGELVEDSSLQKDMNRMIRQSDNAAATRVLNRVGKDRLLDILQDPRYLLYDKQHNGGLWVGKAYAKGQAYKRDPLSNVSHGATVMQVARFYYLLDTERLVNADLSKKMKDILANPAIKHKFVKGLRDVEGASIYRKSGTWKQYHADSALVEFGEHKYIIVGIAIHNKGGQWLERLARPLHDMIVSEDDS